MKKNEHYNFFADSAQSFTYVVDVISILSQHNSPCKFLIIYIFFNDFWSPKGDLKKKDLNLSPAVFVTLSLCHASPYLVLTKTNEADLICIFRSFFKTDRFKCLDNRCSLLFYEGHKFCTRTLQLQPGLFVTY